MKPVSRIKGITVRRHLDTSTFSVAKGGCRWSICLTLRGQKKYYPVEPAIYMDPKFWVAQDDPTTGGKIREKAIIHAKGNPNSRKQERILVEAEAKMWGIIEALLKAGEVGHALVMKEWILADVSSLAVFASEYLSGPQGALQPNTLSLRKRFVRLIEDYDNAVSITAVNWQWIAGFEEWLRTKVPNGRNGKTHGYKKSSIHSVLSFLNQVLNHAEMIGMTTTNAMSKYKAFKQRKSNKEEEINIGNPLSEGEVQILQNAWDARCSNTLTERELWCLQQALVCIYTGFRYSDLRQLQFESRYTISSSHISLTIAKTGRFHQVPKSDRLRNVLTPQPNGSLLLGPVRNNCNTNIALRKLIQKLGLSRPVRWHDLRKTFVTILYGRTRDLKAVSLAVGHSKSSITEQHYLKVVPEQVDKVVMALDNDRSKPIPNSQELLSLVAAMVSANPGIVLPPEFSRVIGELGDYRTM